MKQEVVIKLAGEVKFFIERVEPDPFNTDVIAENIEYGYKATSKKSGAEYFKWIRKDGTVYASPLQRKVVDRCLAELNK